MKKVTEYISKITRIRIDYILHFGVGLAFGLPCLILQIPHTMLIASVIFIAKEVYDKYKPNPTGFDWLDLAADYSGLTISIFIIWILI